MDKVTKALIKLNPKERSSIEAVLLQIKNGSIEGLDIKALKGYKNIFRVRKGRIRIIFEMNNTNTVILGVENRSEKTYKF